MATAVFAKRKKYRDVQQNPPRRVHGRRRGFRPAVEGAQHRDPRRDEIVPMGGSALGPGFDAEMFRLRPKRIVSWGLDGTMMQQNARSVG